VALDDSALWNKIVRGGVLENTGMVAFSPELTQSQTDAIRAYVIQRANDDLAKQKTAGKP
jgi:hypothetical protein